MQEQAIDHSDVSTLPTKELQALVHELRVHQIELETQNWEHVLTSYQQLRFTNFFAVVRKIIAVAMVDPGDIRI